MAWRARITAVEGTVSGQDEGGNPITIDLTLAGMFRVTAEYFDSAAPATILHSTSFQWPVTVTQAQAVNRVIAEGQKVLSTRARVIELQANVGATINVPVP